MKKLFVGAMLLLLSTMLLSCSSTGTSGQNSLNAKYYVGTQGVVATYDSLNPTYYYYGPGDSTGNTFQFSVDVENRGASFTRGGVYVSGFNPDIFKFEEFTVPNQPQGACSLGIGTIGWGELGGIFRCDGVNIASNGHVTTITIDSVKNALDQIIKNHEGTRWLDRDSIISDIGLSYTNGPGGNNFQMNFNNFGGRVDYYQHGRLFIVYLSGIDFKKNGGQEFLLAGRTPDYPGGEQAYFTYTGHIVDWPPGTDTMPVPMMLTTCYQYTTYADPMICVDPDPYSENRKVCKPQSRTWGGGNGAPVAITSVEQENTPKKIIFHINVKNIGTGEVYDPGKLEKCSPYMSQRVTAEDKNIVYLGDVRIGNVGLMTSNGQGGMTCNPQIIRLDPKTKTGSTTCSYPLQYANIKSGYMTPLTVELWYGYSETVLRTVNFKKVV